MFDKKTPKNAKKFICEKCNFKCGKQSEYNRHLSTIKHNMLDNAGNKTPKNANVFKCDCGKEYKHNQSYYRHKKNCIINNDNNNNSIIQTNDNSTILSLISQNKELMNMLVVQKEETKELIEQNKKMQQTIQEIVPKIGNNNTTNTTNNNQFNLNVFLNEDCKDAINFSEFIENMKVSFEDLEHQADVGYINGVSKLFIENLRDLGTHKRPIHCTDKKRKTLYIKENDTWDKEGSQNTLRNGIQEVSRKGFECLSNEKKENQEEYEDIESNFSQKCLTIQRNLIPNAPRETTINKVIENISKISGVIE
jgi:hypothetical protein